MFKNIKTSKNPFILFLPFLFTYVAIILIFSTNESVGDESRYLTYAQNIINGFYSPPPPNVDLGNGPGYSLVLVPFVALNLPFIVIKLLNAIFCYLSIVFLFKALLSISSFKFSLIFSIIWGLYPNTFAQITYILPEVFVSSLIPLLIFLIVKTFKDIHKKKVIKYIILSGITIGFIALTKPIFGYVIIFMIGGTFFLWLFNIRNTAYKKSIAIFLIAFITTIPWLAYTYHMSGKFLYWSSFGGNNLYWMSTPFENEYGDWSGYPNLTHEPYTIPGSMDQIEMNHKKDFETILENKQVQEDHVRNGVIYGNPYNGIVQDDLLKKIAIQNIKAHPIKFLQNCISNVGRIVFNYPASYTLQKPSTLFRLPINGVLLVFAFFCLIPTLLNWRNVPFSIRFLLLFALIYLGGSILGSAGPRMLTVALPILLFWISFISEKTIKINLKFKKNLQSDFS